MFNISDALLDGRDFVAQFRNAPGQAKVQYEPGYGEEVSFHDGFWHEITLADHPDGPDHYDDTVILHEYGHWLADEYSCNDSPGGEHFSRRHYSRGLAWSEGWASYLSSGVRNDPWYLDRTWNGGWDVQVDWETWSISGSTNEGAVAATLWDVFDPDNEPHDRIGLGGDEIWDIFDEHMNESLFTDPFRSCDIPTFYEIWLEEGHPDDPEFAAVFDNYNASTLMAQTTGPRSAPIEPTAARVVGVGPAYGPDGRAVQPQGISIDAAIRQEDPWTGTLFLVDATDSMVEEIDAVKEIIQTQVTELDAEPNAYEYVVETFQDSGANTPVVDDSFPDIVNPEVDNITIGGGGGPEEDSFAALIRGTEERTGFDSWLLTDGALDTIEASIGQTEGVLQNREVTPYFFIFGDCDDGNLAGSEPAGQSARIIPAGQLHLPRFAPSALEDCIEPYLYVSDENTGIPTTAAPNNAIYAFWDDLWTFVIPDGQTPEQTYEHDTANDHFAIVYRAYHVSAVEDTEEFQILLDFDTGESTL